MARRFKLFKRRGTKAKKTEPSAAPQITDFCVAQKKEELIIPVISCGDEIELTTPNEISSEEKCSEMETHLQEEENSPDTTVEDQNRIIDMQKVLASSQEKSALKQKDGTEETSTLHHDEYTFSSSDSQDDDDDSIAYLWRFIGCAPKLRSTFSVMHDDESTIQSFYTFKSINDNSIISDSKSDSSKKDEFKHEPSEQKSAGFWDRILCGSPSSVKHFQ